MIRKTKLVIVIIILLIAIWDIIAISKGGVEASISHVLIVWSYKFPAFTFLMGFTMGHLFWRVKDTRDTRQITEHIEKE